jgi:hypothetical protein
MSLPKHRILVCGGRKFGCLDLNCPPELFNEAIHNAQVEQAFLRQTLSNINDKAIIEVLIEGDAKGADKLAGRWAEDNGVPRLTFPADWDTHGKAAGSIRNQQMLDEGKPTLVIAFPGGRGTKDMVRRAKKAGLPVYEVVYETV